MDDKMRTAPDIDQIPSIAKDTRTLSLNIADAPFAPESWHHLAKAAIDYEQHMVRMMNEETKALNEGKAGAGGLMTSFVRAINVKQKDNVNGKTNGSPKGLTINEIFSKIFVINFAGHDTTANTLSFVMLLLAAYPEVHDWLAEELQGITGPQAIMVCEPLSEITSHSHLLAQNPPPFPPIPMLPKQTNHQPQPLQVGDRTIIIPPNIAIHPNVLAMHFHPSHWEDPIAGSPRDEQILTPQRCTYFPWSDGPQNCPRNKFSQVEIVAVVASFLRHHRIHAVPNPGETFEETRARVLGAIKNMDIQLLLQMKNADQVRLVCERVAVNFDC
ncbi:cytochrome P450 [Aspergillus sclerotiicarbonarius CBS 121057]|uniref:Cytochrome P450 n=1 Tax=Aspergillus sclerotiicarbonarius (strain CBS 121057 / IBT 28362) TaxID=1448318 RepID=A0A319E2B4_ASPSB|nr:cytochrome P450 [Aspergillus sclerotiicarbonarius CBS 121057]